MSEPYRTPAAAPEKRPCSHAERYRQDMSVGSLDEGCNYETRCCGCGKRLWDDELTAALTVWLFALVLALALVVAYLSFKGD